MPEFPSFPNEAALKALERRGRKFEPSGYWWTVWQKQHQTAFTVAQSAGYDILADICQAVQKAIAEGITYREFEMSLTPILQKKGWWGRTEDGRQLGAPWRLKTIFQQNLRVSAAQGEWEEIQELKEERPYLRYTALVDGRTRPLHKSWQGTILPVDDPWWQTHFPPNGWNCRCKALSVSEAELEFYGWKVSARAPKDGYREWVNPATGQTMRVPNGIDPGWDYNPGAVDPLQKAMVINQSKWDRLQSLLQAPVSAFTPVVQAVATEHELADQIKQHVSQFTRNGPITDVYFVNDSFFMATNSRGKYWISDRTFPKCNNFNAKQHLMDAWNKLATNISLTFDEEYAIESLWHETVHNKQLGDYAAGKDTISRRMMEIITQWVARRTYPDFIRALGGKARHQAKIIADGYGYRSYLKNFDNLLAQLGIADDKAALNYFKNVIVNTSCKKYRKAIVDYITSNIKFTISRKELNWALGHIDYSENGFNNVIKYRLLGK